MLFTERLKSLVIRKGCFGQIECKSGLPLVEGDSIRLALVQRESCKLYPKMSHRASISLTHTPLSALTSGHLYYRYSLIHKM